MNKSILLDLVKENCSELGDDYQAIANFLNAPTYVANPRAGEIDTEERVIPVTMDSILAAVPTNEAAIIYTKVPNLIVNMQEAVDANNMQWLAYLLGVAVESSIGAISQETAGKLLALSDNKEVIETVQPDTIHGPSLASAAGLGSVKSFDVQQAMN